jgi:hypothetical protein
MSLAAAPSPSNPKLSQQICAVLILLSADPHLMKSVEPFINLDTETISWDAIFKIPFGSGHRGAVSWAYSIWTDEMRPRANIFDGALSMSPALQVAVLQALAKRWGLSRTPSVAG